MSNFKNLRVWLRAKELAKTIYLLSNKGSFSKDFGFRDQVRRSVVSIASNISEGDESGTDKMAVRYFYVAKGSAAELYTQIAIAEDIGYLDNNMAKEIINECEAISAMLHKLIKSRCE